ncbi:hypothetical protein Pla123a_32010 [Posidoniimonas polymericola]|uniref:PEP-CTERM protein-sorting domain-containing protein n=2 Tax=Posidoniimonas polymericola TaxID=2528002 RepID=A0A5C5YLC4_9BACT|nr:hypothetical protein Pla123a_32010 [Posidoniimonas polymericola]
MLLAAGMLCAATGHSQDLVLRVNRATGALQLTGASSTVVSLAGYTVDSKYGTLDLGNPFPGIRGVDADWKLAGVPDASAISEYNFNPSPGAFNAVDSGVTYDLGNLYDPAGAFLNEGFAFDVEVDDLVLTYADLNFTSPSIGVVEYFGDGDTNNIGITVNLATGTAFIENESPFDQVLVGYNIVAGSAGILNTNAGSFNGLRDEAGGSAFQPPSTLTGDALSELDPTVDQNAAGISITAGQSYDLGMIGDSGGNLQDLAANLSFSFLFAGAGEQERSGFVKYLGVLASGPGDFNADGVVDAADYTLWRDNDGAADESAINGNGDGGGITNADYDLWKSNYGTDYGAGTVGTTSTTPEPAAAGLMAFAVSAVAGCMRSRAFGVK